MMRGRGDRAFEPAEVIAHAGSGAAPGRRGPLGGSGRGAVGTAGLRACRRLPGGGGGGGGEGIQIAPRHFYFIADLRLS
jgi:hypothetical protein